LINTFVLVYKPYLTIPIRVNQYHCVTHCKLYQ